MNDHSVMIATELHSVQWLSASVTVTSSDREHEEGASPAECTPVISKNVNHIEIYRGIESILI